MKKKALITLVLTAALTLVPAAVALAGSYTRHAPIFHR